MVFSTNLFLFLFLPVFLAVYYLLPFRARSPWILLASYAFYAWWRIDFLLLFAGVTLWTYLWGRSLAAVQELRPKRLRLIFGLAGNLGALAYFKYFNFGLENLNALLASLGARPLTLWHVLLPIGLSFYVFQAMSYLVDVYRGDVEATDNFWDFSAFIALFPQLIAGPILRYKDLADQFKSREHSLQLFSDGALRFMMGFCKKVLIADAVAPVVTKTLFHADPTFVDVWLGAVAFTLQIFFDFSGYSDMAIGLGLMMGFRFKENFDHPYYAKSIGEFWRRWHISLSAWVREYIYYPLGGNKRGRLRTYFNVAAVMIIIGIWHGANWTFIVYGVLHASMLVRERRRLYNGRWRERPAHIAIPLTMFFVVAARILFLSPDLASAWALYQAAAGLNGFGLSEFLYWQLTGFEVFMLVFAAAFVYAAPRWLEFLSTRPATPWAQVQLTVLPLFALAIARLSAQDFSPFLYFNF